MDESMKARMEATEALLERGHATVREILTASFGEWPLRGLSINTGVPHDQEVDLQPLSAYKAPTKGKGFLRRQFTARVKMWNILGRGTIEGERRIWLNDKKTLRDPGWKVQTLGHEVTHILQGDNFFRAAELYGRKLAADHLWTHHTNMRAAEIMEPLLARERERRLPRLRNFFNWVAADGSKRRNYLQEGIEVQARLHEVMAEGYQQWGAMPNDMLTFWAALRSAGLKPPADVSQMLDEMPRDFPARHFDRIKLPMTKAVRDLRVVAGSLTNEGREELWKKTLPALYGDLIEMYGDAEGRRRMGQGPSTLGYVQQQAFGPKEEPLVRRRIKPDPIKITPEPYVEQQPARIMQRPPLPPLRP